MHQARQPATPMEWSQEIRERMYAEQERHEWQARFEEAPTDERTDDANDTDSPDIRR